MLQNGTKDIFKAVKLCKITAKQYWNIWYMSIQGAEAVELQIKTQEKLTAINTVVVLQLHELSNNTKTIITSTVHQSKIHNVTRKRNMSGSFEKYRKICNPIQQYANHKHSTKKAITCQQNSSDLAGDSLFLLYIMQYLSLTQLIFF